jgi:hypothetical protein
MRVTGVARWAAADLWEGLRFRGRKRWRGGREQQCRRQPETVRYVLHLPTSVLIISIWARFFKDGNVDNITVILNNLQLFNGLALKQPLRLNFALDGYA